MKQNGFSMKNSTHWIKIYGHQKLAAYFFTDPVSNLGYK